jgi:hypothetical protein
MLHYFIVQTFNLATNTKILHFSYRSWVLSEVYNLCQLLPPDTRCVCHRLIDLTDDGLIHIAARMSKLWRMTVYNEARPSNAGHKMSATCGAAEHHGSHIHCSTRIPVTVYYTYHYLLSVMYVTDQVGKVIIERDILKL